jgi:hypothetical protein
MDELLLVKHFEVVSLVDHLDSMLGVIGFVVGTVSHFFDQSLLFSDLLYSFL